MTHNIGTRIMGVTVPANADWRWWENEGWWAVLAVTAQAGDDTERPSTWHQERASKLMRDIRSSMRS